MKCPNCNKPDLKYLQSREKIASSKIKQLFPRTDFHAKCKHCKWEGKI